MLKSKYSKLDDIPEGDRQHYKQIAGEWVLELDGSHPVQETLRTVTEEKRTELAKVNQRAASAEAEVQTLKNQAANNPTLPSGHVPVPADKAKLLDAIEELGEGADFKAKFESVKTKLTEHANLSTENAQLKKEGLLRKVADSGIGGKRLNLKRLELLDKDAGGLSYEERDVSVTENGKTTTQKAWQVKDGNKWVTLSEYYDTHWKDLGIPLTDEAAPAGTRVAGQVPADPNGANANIYDQIRKDAAEKQKAQQIVAIPLEQRLHMS